jgi:hypothetical protein
MMRMQWWVGACVCAATGACTSDFARHTRAFVPAQRCSQGPFDVHLTVTGKTAEEGIEIVACTPRRIAGRVAVTVDRVPLTDEAFGDGADNARCVAGPSAVVVTAAAPAAGNAAAAAGDELAPPGRSVAQLVEQPYRGSETPFEDELCRPTGRVAQRVLGPFSWRPDESPFGAGADVHVRLWSDAPNDLDGVVFFVRYLTSNRSRAEVKEEYEASEKDPPTVERPRAAGHGPPPAPLAESRPPPPSALVDWVPGYWTWSGAAWGWVAGFWRDARLDMPAPQPEVPGAPPGVGALWIGGTWHIQAGAWVWIGGRWHLP